MNRGGGRESGVTYELIKADTGIIPAFSGEALFRSPVV